MSWTKREFIQRAFEELGLAAYIFNISADQLQAALYRLDAMVAGWNAIGMRLGYPLPGTPKSADLDESTSVPDSAVEAIYTNLALKLAPSYGKQVSPDLRANATLAYNNMATHCMENTTPQLQRNSLPAGAGNKLYRTVFLPKTPDELYAGMDSEIDFGGNVNLDGETLP